MSRSRLVAFVSVALAALGALSAAAEDAPAPVAPAPVAPAAPAAAAPRSFASAEDAGKALAAAFARNDDQALRDLLGIGSEEVVEKGADPAVAAIRKRIATDAAAKVVAAAPAEDGHVSLLLGIDGWPFPIPLAKEGDGWRFDVAAGRAELLARKIGRHELEVIGICRSYADMQTAYAAEDRDGDQVREYAQRLLSRPGTHDGLWWEDASGDDPSPLGLSLTPLNLANGERAPYAGYYWRILTAQGHNVPGGAHSFVINGNMIAGFALVAVPAEYRRTGVMTFLVSHHGKVFQKDQGERSLDLARAMATFDPDATWEELKPAEMVAAEFSEPKAQ